MPWRSLLAWAALLAFVAALGLGLLVPLYIDESASKLVQARFLAEDGQIVGLLPQCGASFIQDTPATWQPAALLYALIYADLSPLGLRLSGVVVAGTWLLALAGWAAVTGLGSGGRPWTVAAVTSAVGLGVMPLTLGLARAEQWVLLLLTGFLVFPALGARVAGSRWPIAGGLGLLGAFLLATSLFFYTHPKALFFLPLVLVSAAATFAGRSRAMVTLAAAFALVAAAQSLDFARKATRCEDAPMVASILQSLTVPVQMLADAPVAFGREAAANLVSAPGRIAGHAVFQPEYQSGWLPPMAGRADVRVPSGLNRLVSVAIQVIYWAGLLLTPLVLLRRSLSRRSGPDMLLAATLWLGLVAHVALYRVWNFYSGVLVIGIAAMLTVISAGSLRDLALFARIETSLRAGLLGLALASTAALAYSMGPALLDIARRPVLDPHGQPYSVNVYAFDEAASRIRALTHRCGLSGDDTERLVVDDLTYYAFTGLRVPLHAAFVWSGGWGADLAGHTRGFLLGMGSPGIVARCTFVAPEFYDDVVREGDLCCVNLFESNGR